MKHNKFFQWVWRLNALLILALTLTLSGFLIYQAVKAILREPPREPIVDKIAEDPEQKERWTLGYPQPVHGTDELILPLESENREVVQEAHLKADMRYIAPRSLRAKNLLFINTVTQYNRWLFPNTQQLIVHMEQFPLLYRNEQESPHTRLMFYHLIDTDTNGDERIDYADQTALYASKPDGSDLRRIIDGMDTVIASTASGEQAVHILYQTQGSAYALLLDINTLQIMHQSELPKIGE